MYRSEGLLSYWKGIIPPILAETPKRATKFVCFEQYKKLFMFGAEKPTPLVSMSFGNRIFCSLRLQIKKKNPIWFSRHFRWPVLEQALQRLLLSIRLRWSKFPCKPIQRSEVDSHLRSAQF